MMQKQSHLPLLASYVLSGCALLLVLQKGLVAALFAGLLTYSLVHLLAPSLGKQISGRRARVIAVTGLGILIVALLSLASWGTISFFRSDAGSVSFLLQKMADIIEASRHQMPEWLKGHIPASADALGALIIEWLRAHATEAKFLGQEAGRTIVHLIVGMIIGAMVALHDDATQSRYLPLANALRGRLLNLSDAFRRIVFAQVRIAALNAVITAIFLLIALPCAGIHLPLSKSLVAITFFAGLLPVVGNLISNSVLVIVALSHSLNIALVSLLFMIVIHKLEYFANAKIIGTQINARAWELLIAMLVMESIFGLPGVVAAPVLYAYLKKELMDAELV